MMVNIPKVLNENYCARVVEIEKIVALPNRDKIVGALIFGNQVIVSKDTKVGDVGIFFPVETALSAEFMAFNNLHQDNTLNNDPSKKGFFGSKGRVKCQKFGGHKSEGFFIPLDSLEYVFHAQITKDDLPVGTKFEILDGKEICKKYVIKDSRTPREPGSKQKKSVKLSRLVDNQFRLHFDTLNLRMNAHKLNPNDYISISSKYHGTSWVVGKVLVKDPIWQHTLAMKITGIDLYKNKKIAKYLKYLIKPAEKFQNYLIGTLLNVDNNSKPFYDVIWSSRKVVKNAFANPNPVHYYGMDIWGEIAEHVKDHIPAGITLYGECVGYLPNGSAIQSSEGKCFDYGCEPGTYKLIVYRITSTNAEGKVFEFSWPQILEFCNRISPYIGSGTCVGLETPNTYYYGKAKDYAPQIPIETHWNENFLAKLEKDFMKDADCPFCKNVVPEEGIIISKETLYERESFKLKNFRFLNKESEELDKEVVDIETSQSEEDPV
jgi:hypothetical protein